MARQQAPGRRVREFIRIHQLVTSRLVTSRRPLLVAVSGGQDSVCLFHILVGLRDELGIKLHVAHLDHRLRGAAARADARYVAELAARFGVPATVERRDVRAYRKQHRLSLEEAAREVRYDFLAQVAEAVGADEVAVGHTIDDNIETILMHLVRGTGTRGLRGLPPDGWWQSSRKRLRVIRPLLQVSRQETADYCAQHGLTPRMDASNLSLSPLRNKIRRQLLPLLEDYNPAVGKALLRMARIADDELAFLDREGARWWADLARRQGDTITLDKEMFLGLPAALKRHLLRTAVAALLGNLKDIEARHIEDLMAALGKPAGRRLGLPGGLVFTVEYDRYLLGLDPAALSPFPVVGGEAALNIPGETLLDGWRIEAAIVSPREVSTKTEGISGSSGEDRKASLTAHLDFGRISGGLVVRGRRAGDRFQPLGMSQSKKLGEFMIDAKIPRAWRERVPVVCSAQHVLWVVGWRIDDRVKVSGSTQQVLRLTFVLTAAGDGN